MDAGAQHMIEPRWSSLYTVGGATTQAAEIMVEFPRKRFAPPGWSASLGNQFPSPNAKCLKIILTLTKQSNRMPTIQAVLPFSFPYSAVEIQQESCLEADAADAVLTQSRGDSAA